MMQIASPVDEILRLVSEYEYLSSFVEPTEGNLGVTAADGGSWFKLPFFLDQRNQCEASTVAMRAIRISFFRPF